MDKKRTEEIAANRLQMISPLLDPTLDDAKRQVLKEEITIQYGISERTLRRRMNKYRGNGFDGLKPKAPETSGKSKIPESLMAEAIRLRREVPSRSVTELIRILEWEGVAEPGFLRRSSLQNQQTFPLHDVSRSRGAITFGSRLLPIANFSVTLYNKNLTFFFHYQSYIYFRQV